VTYRLSDEERANLSEAQIVDHYGRISFKGRVMSKALQKELEERLADLKLKQATELALASPSQRYLDDLSITIDHVQRRLKVVR